MGVIVEEMIGSGSRQREVFTLLLSGRPEKEIATALSMSTHTVHGHTKRIYRLVRVKSRSELLATVLGRMEHRLRGAEAVPPDTATLIL